MGIQSHLQTHPILEVRMSIKKVRANYTNPYGNKLRTVKGRHSIDLVRTAYRGLSKGHINAEEFERLVIVASSIPNIPPNVILFHYLLIEIEKQFKNVTFFNPELNGGAS
jgi:hypothetical protein